MTPEPATRRIFLQVTDRCAAACPHCGFDCTAAGAGLLAVDRAADFLDQLARRRVRPTHLALTGGEPMLFPKRTCELARLARERGLVVRLITGGSWIRDRLGVRRALAELAAAGVSGLWLSAGALTAGSPDRHAERLGWLLDAARDQGLATFLNFVYFLPAESAMRGRGLPGVDPQIPADLKTRQAHAAWAEALGRAIPGARGAHGWARIWDAGRARALIDALGPARAGRVRAALAAARSGPGALDRDLIGLGCDGQAFAPHPEFGG